MARRKVPGVQDPDGEAWHAESSRRWASAVDLATVLGESPLDMFTPVPLPDFNAKRPQGVSRDLLGRFLLDMATNVLHDAHAASPCDLDGIRRGTFFHFWSEVPPHVNACERCIP
jgi:hypothetical protein